MVSGFNVFSAKHSVTSEYQPGLKSKMAHAISDRGLREILDCALAKYASVARIRFQPGENKEIDYIWDRLIAW